MRTSVPVQRVGKNVGFAKNEREVEGRGSWREGWGWIREGDVDGNVSRPLGCCALQQRETP
eukprot:2358552-Rhodomonas_salina.1